MLYRHVFDKSSTEFRGIFRVFVNFAGFRGFTWISRLRDRAKYQKPLLGGQFLRNVSWSVVPCCSCVIVLDAWTHRPSDQVLHFSFWSGLNVDNRPDFSYYSTTSYLYCKMEINDWQVPFLLFMLWNNIKQSTKFFEKNSLFSIKQPNLAI